MYLHQQVRHLEGKVKELQQINDDIEEKKVTAKKETVRAEIKLQHVLRDIELKNIQIDNLKSVCMKSEQDFDRVMNDMTKFENNTAGVVGKMKKIEYEKARLIDDNVKLLNENEKIRQQLLNFTFMKSGSDHTDSDKFEKHK